MRAILIVIDSFGIGAQFDSAKYGDEGSNTYEAIAPYCTLPNLELLGLKHINGICAGVSSAPLGSYGRMIELSPGKDTTTGHWELAGVVLQQPFPTYPNGFPEEVITKLEAAFGTSVIGNMAASGTEIIKDLGELHLATGYPIVYTSADSVLQIAAHVDKVPLKKLYEYCRMARRIMCGKHAVGRIIARPFIGPVGAFSRTADRKDFSLPVPEGNVLSYLKNKGFAVKGVGKINDIFGGEGITENLGGHTNEEVIALTLDAVKQPFDGLLFVNLVETDMLYGHRNDTVGYAKCMENVDGAIGRLLPLLQPEDLLIITADHGCDPSTPSTDHSRESVPLLVYHAGDTPQNLGVIEGFNYVAKLIKGYLTK